MARHRQANWGPKPLKFHPLGSIFRPPRPRKRHFSPPRTRKRHFWRPRPEIWPPRPQNLTFGLPDPEIVTFSGNLTQTARKRVVFIPHCPLHGRALWQKTGTHFASRMASGEHRFGAKNDPPRTRKRHFWRPRPEIWPPRPVLGRQDPKTSLLASQTRNLASQTQKSSLFAKMTTFGA